MARKGLGKGLASLIPDFYNEDFDSNSTQSLEDMLNDNEDADSKTEEEVQIEENISTEDNKIEDEVEENDQKDSEIQTEETPRQGSVNDKVPNKETEVDTNQEDSESEVLSSGKSSEDGIQTTQEIQVNQQHIEEVKEIVNKNPRITLWSSRSSAVFRYLRKTEPEFSISKEASILIDEAVSKKYPEIWKLFEDD